MTLTPGTRLGVFELGELLGRGGMGEVYRATDTHLKRQVAIKVLPASMATDAERLARFQREAEVLAALNHPNIAAIYGLEKSPSTGSGQAGITALVMELVEGEDLSQRIATGAIPIDEALPIAKQIAEALEAAHEQGIIHRDLKPANIKVRSDGTVKVLDFGLAKAIDQAGGAGRPGAAGGPAGVYRPDGPGRPDPPDFSASPTMTSLEMLTGAGMILGTAAYMAPEQAKGRPVDRRADIWAFGAVLFEMLTGRRAFPGDDFAETFAAVIRGEPDWSGLPADTPAPVRRLLRRCLERDVTLRMRDAGDVRLELVDAARGPDAPPMAIRSQSPRWLRVLPWAIASLALVGAAFIAASRPRGTNAASRRPVYATLEAPPGYALGEALGASGLPMRAPMVFTPDGHALVILAVRDGRSQLFLRPLDRPDAQPIGGTEGGRMPFVSPDGKWVGFWAAGELRKIPIQGGTPTTICALRYSPSGAAWGSGDVIVYADAATRRLMRVSAGGGALPVAVTPEPPSDRQHVSPFLLPDGTHVLYSDVRVIDSARDVRVMVQALDGGDATLVIEDAVDARLLPSGQLAFMRSGTLMTVGFDTARVATIGEPVAAMTGVMQSGLRGVDSLEHPAAGLFAVSSLGTLAAIRGPVVGPNTNTQVWATMDGTLTPAEPESGAPVGSRQQVRISPDGTRAATSVVTPLSREVWISDLVRNVWTLCTDCGGFRVEWAPDSRRLLVGRGRSLVVHAIDGSSKDQTLVTEDGPSVSLVPAAWLADGRIVYMSAPTSDLARVEVKLLEPGAAVGRVVVTLGMGSSPVVSPDGRWVAYDGQVPNRPANIFVQAFPDGGERVQVSANGATGAKWSANGRTLYYVGRTPEGQSTLVTAVDVKVDGSRLVVGQPRVLFRAPTSQVSVRRMYDITENPVRFLLRQSAPPPSVARMDLITNWLETLSTGH